VLIGSSETHGELLGERRDTSGLRLDRTFALLETKLLFLTSNPLTETPLQLLHRPARAPRLHPARTPRLHRTRIPTRTASPLRTRLHLSPHPLVLLVLAVLHQVTLRRVLLLQLTPHPPQLPLLHRVTLRRVLLRAMMTMKSRLFLSLQAKLQAT